MQILSVLVRKIKTFFSIDNKLRIEFIQAFIYEGMYRAFILFVPFNKLKKRMGKHKKESVETVDIEVYKEARHISWIVAVTSSKTPWESKCLVQALTAQKMLKKKGISTTIYLGVRKEGNEMKAHAWVRCGQYYVTGGAIREQYAVVAKFCN